MKRFEYDKTLYFIDRFPYCDRLNCHESNACLDVFSRDCRFL